MSRYSKLLNKIIAESGYTSKEIVKKCNDMGNDIDTTRLSKLINGRVPAPSEKVSRDISRACNADERKLVIEGYLEKAPNEIREVFSILKETSFEIGLKIFQNHITKEQIEIIKEEISKQPLSDIIIEILDGKNNSLNITTTGLDFTSKSINLNLSEPIMLEVNDDSMYPIIKNGSRVALKIEEKYNNGDILAIKIKNKEEILFRYAFFNQNDIILISLKQGFQPLTYSMYDIIILGRVARIVSDI